MRNSRIDLLAPRVVQQLDSHMRSTETAFVGHRGGNSAVVFDKVDLESRYQIDDESDICMGLPESIVLRLFRSE